MHPRQNLTSKGGVEENKNKMASNMMPSAFDSYDGWTLLSPPGVAVIIAAIVACVVSRTSRKSLQSIPGPFSYPVVGNLLQIIATGDLEIIVRRWKQRYGKVYQFTFLGKNIVVLSDPDDIRHIMTSNKYLIRWENDGLGVLGMDQAGVIQNNNKDLWKLHRRMFSSSLSGSDFQKHAALVAGQKADILLHRHLLPSDAASSSSTERTVNVAACLKLFSLDVIGNLALGREFGALEEGEDSKLARIVVGFFIAWDFFLINPPLVWKFLYNKSRALKNNIASLRCVEMNTLADAREVMSRSDAEEKTTDFPMLLLKQKQIEQDKAGSKVDASAFSDEMLCQDIREMIVGGTDSTSNLLAFICYSLAKFPELAQKVREEIESTVPTNLSDPGFYTSLSKLPYTDAFIKEVSRLYPVVTLNTRCSTEDDEVGGYFIPAGTYIIMNYADSFLDPNFIKEPESFIPDRWLDKTESAALSKLVFPFGYGARSCPGQHLAWMEMRAALARILPMVDIQLHTPGQNVERFWNVVTKPKNGILMLKFSPRANSKVVQ